MVVQVLEASRLQLFRLLLSESVVVGGTQLAKFTLEYAIYIYSHGIHRTGPYGLAIGIIMGPLSNFLGPHACNRPIILMGPYMPVIILFIL